MVGFRRVPWGKETVREPSGRLEEVKAVLCKVRLRGEVDVPILAVGEVRLVQIRSDTTAVRQI